MKTFSRIFLITLLGIISVPIARADELPRHGVIGLAVAPPDTTKPDDVHTNPPTVKTVAPGSAGEAAGILPGDIPLELDGARVTSSTEFAARIGRHLAGDRVPILISRNGKELTLSAVLKPRPYETSPDAEVIYSSVTVEGTRRRTIITRPKAPGRYPTVLIMGGLGCYSLDGAQNSYGGLIAALAKQNYVTMRVEKTGQGDSEGPACTDLKATAELEAQGYIAGLQALKKSDYVDAAKIFVFAHSLGPLVGSLVVPRETVRGFIAAETIGRSWYEYMLENFRMQDAMTGTPLDTVEAELRVHERCAHDFFMLHHSAEEIGKIDPQCTGMIRSFAGVPDSYMQQIGDISLAKQWKSVDIPVLVLYGTSDPATSAYESRYFVSLINSLHPGRATYVELPGMGHDFYLYDSQLEFLTRRSNPTKQHAFDQELTDSILKWLREQVPA